VWQRIGIDAWNIARPALFLIEPGTSATRSWGRDRFPGMGELREMGAGGSQAKASQAQRERI
jgi:hypothetical protein